MRVRQLELSACDESPRMHLNVRYNQTLSVRLKRSSLVKFSFHSHSGSIVCCVRTTERPLNDGTTDAASHTLASVDRITTPLHTLCDFGACDVD